MKKLLALLFAAVLPLAAQVPVALQKEPKNPTSPALPGRLNDQSKVFIVPATGSITADPGGVIAATSIPTITIATTAPLTGGGALTGNLTLAIPAATGSVNGYLTSTDWTTFNAKQPAGSYITALTGDGTAAGPGSVAFTLATVNANVGTFAAVTVNGKGLVTAAANLSGDLTTSAAVATLATVNSNVGSFGSSTAIPVFTVNGKGLITAASTVVVIAPAGTLTGATLAANVLASSLTSVGTLTGGATGAGFTVALGTSTITGTLGVTNGGNGLATATLGDLRYGSGTNTLAALAGSTSATMAVLTQTGNGTVSAAPVWTSTIGTGNVVRATSPTLVTPTIGAATATSINGLTLTASTGTFTLANLKTLTVSNTLTFTGTDSASVNFGAGGTVLYSGGSYVSSIAGTAGQITASASTGAVTLSLPSTLTQATTFSATTVTNASGGNSLWVSNRGANTNLVGMKTQTSAVDDWLIGNAGSADSDFHVYSYTLSADAFKLLKSTGAATFTAGVTVNGTAGIANPVANGILNLGDNASGPNLRLVGSSAGSNAFLQVGMSSADTSANLVLSRYQTSSTAFNSLTVYTNIATFSNAVTVTGSILGSGGSAPTNTSSGSNQFTAGLATGGPFYGTQVFNAKSIITTTGVSASGLFTSTTNTIGWFLDSGDASTGAPTFTMVDASASSGSRIWDTAITGGAYKIRAINDAYSSSSILLTLSRAGALSIASGLTATTGAFTGALLVTNPNPNTNIFRVASGEGTPTYAGDETVIFERNFNSAQAASISILAGTASTSTIRFANSGNATAGSVQFNHSTGNLGLNATTTTVSGNLTVSGAGTSSIAGALNIVGALTSAAASGTSYVIAKAGTTTSFANLALQDSTASRTLEIVYNGSGNGTVYGIVAGTPGINAQTSLTFSIGDTKKGILTASALDFSSITTSGISTTVAALLAKSAGFTENVYVGGTGNFAGAVNITSNSLTVNSGSGTQTFTLGDGTLTKASGSGFILGSALKPASSNDNANDLGALGAQWRTIYLGTSLINAGTTEATTGGAGSLTTAGGIYATKKIISGSSFQGGTPSGGTSAAWIPGTVVTGVTATMVTTNYIQLDVGGTLYKLATVTSVP